MLKKALIPFFFLCCCSLLRAQTNNCFEIKYLDFFELDKEEDIKWPADELDALLSDTTLNDPRFTRNKTNFLIPLLIVQMAQYHPDCNTQNDTATWGKMLALYKKIRQNDFPGLNSKTRSEQLELLRTDFYSQVNNDSLLPYMIFTIDQGPFFGQLSKYVVNYSKGVKQKTDFGYLVFTSYARKFFLTVLDKEERHIETKVLAQYVVNKLPPVIFTPNDIKHTSLGYTITVSSLGNPFTMYLKENGELRYYYLRF